MISIPHLLIPHLAIPHGALPGDFSHYRVYTLANGSETLLAVVPAGTNSLSVAQSNESDVTYRIRAVSAMGVESTDYAEIRCTKDSEGSLTSGRPNVLTLAEAAPAENGAAAVHVIYSAQSQSAVATAVQVAERIDGTETYDWENPVSAIALYAAGVTNKTETTETTWSHGQMIRLAVRAVTAEGVAGPITEIPPLAADAEAPNEIEFLEATQI